MFAFQMREAVIVFATENKYGAQVDQIREGDNNKKGPFSQSFTLKGSGPPPPLVVLWKSEMLGTYFMLWWMSEALKQILHLKQTEKK